MDELKVLYMTVDQVIPLVGPRTTTPTVLNAQVLEHPGANGVVIQWTTNVVVPFDWGVTARGLWRFIAHDQVASHVDQVEVSLCALVTSIACRRLSSYSRHPRRIFVMISTTLSARTW